MHSANMAPAPGLNEDSIIIGTQISLHARAHDITKFEIENKEKGG